MDLQARDYRAHVNMSHMIKSGENYEIIIYGPILAHLERLLIEIDESAYFCLKSMKPDIKKILFFGGG